MSALTCECCQEPCDEREPWALALDGEAAHHSCLRDHGVVGTLVDARCEQNTVKKSCCMGCGVAVCPRCAAPLVATFAFSYTEWYCLDCGNKLGWWMEDREPATPELVAKAAAYKQEWLSYEERLLTGGSMMRDCPKCSNNEPHLRHATDAEVEAHANALAELEMRRLSGAAAGGSET
jgi:hypothetical protein